MTAVSLMGKYNALSPARRVLLAAGLIFIFTLVAYSNSFNGEFHYDDYPKLVKNQYIRSLRNLPGFFADAGEKGYLLRDLEFRPVKYSSLALHYALFGYDRLSYHAFNFMLHVLNSLLLLIVVKEVLDRAGLDNAAPLSLIISLVFAVHPIETSSVDYVTNGRTVMTACFFYLLSFYGFLRIRGGGSGGSVWAFLVPAFFLLGMLTKEILVSLPAVILLYDLVFVVRKEGGLKGAIRSGVHHAYFPILAALAVFLAWKRAVHGYFAVRVLDLGPVEYFMSELKALILYARLMVFPFNQNVDYNLQPTKSLDAVTALAALLIALALILLYRCRKEAPVITFFGFWFFLTLAPESSFISFKDIALEYRLYLPSVGFIAVAVLVMERLLRRREEAFKTGLAASLLVILSVLAFTRNAVWASEYSFWGDAVRKSPSSTTSHVNYGWSLGLQGRYAEAIGEMNRALAIDPEYEKSHVIHYNLGVYYRELGELDTSIKEFRTAISLKPTAKDYYMGLAAAYSMKRDYADAVATLLDVTRLDPSYAQVYYDLSDNCLKLGSYGEALKWGEEAARLRPGDFDAHYNLAVIHGGLGDGEMSVLEAGKALKLASDDAERKDAEALMGRFSANSGLGPVGH